MPLQATEPGGPRTTPPPKPNPLDPASLFPRLPGPQGLPKLPSIEELVAGWVRGEDKTPPAISADALRGVQRGGPQDDERDAAIQGNILADIQRRKSDAAEHAIGTAVGLFGGGKRLPIKAGAKAAAKAPTAVPGFRQTAAQRIASGAAKTVAPPGPPPVPFKQFSLFEKLNGLAQARLVMSIATSAVNTSSNIFTHSMHLAKVAAAEPGELPARLIGNALGFKMAVEMIPDTLRGANIISKWGAVQPSLFGRQGPFFNGVGGTLRNMGNVWGDIEMKVGMGPLAVQDSLVRGPVYYGEVVAAYSRAATARMGSKAWRVGLDNYLKNIPKSVHKEANDIANRVALSNRHPAAKALTGAVHRLAMSKNPAWATAGKALTPFTYFANVSFNLVDQNLANLAFSGWLRAALPGKTLAERRALIAQGTIGVGTLSAALSQLESGDFTPARPRSIAEEALWKAEGRAPLSIRASEYPILGALFTKVLGEEDAKKTWVTPYLLGPLMFNYAAAAGVYQIWDDLEKTDRSMNDKVFASGIAVGAQLVDQMPFILPIAQFGKGLQSLSLEKFGLEMANIARPFVVPYDRMLNFVENVSDSWKRDPLTVYQVLRQGIPGAGMELAPRTDVLGRPIPTHMDDPTKQPHENFAARAWESTLRAAPENPHPVIDKALELRDKVQGFTGLTLVDATVNYGREIIHLDLQERNQLNAITGPIREVRLSALIQSPQFKEATAKEQADMFNKVRNSADDAGKVEFAKRLMAEAQDLPSKLRAMKIATGGANSAYDKALAIIALRPDPMTAIEFDNLRKEVDPASKNYELSIDDHLKGYELVQRWNNAPPWLIGNRDEWAAAKGQAAIYKPMYDQMSREAKVRNIQIERHPDYRTVMRYFAEHRELHKYYNEDGNPDWDLVSKERAAIRKHPLWGKFQSAAADQ